MQNLIFSYGLTHNFSHSTFKNIVVMWNGTTESTGATNIYTILMTWDSVNCTPTFYHFPPDHF